MNTDITTLLLSILAAAMIVAVGTQPIPPKPVYPTLKRTVADTLPSPATAQSATQAAAMARASIAREALKTVGADPKSNAIWEAALNDMEIPPRVRQDLLEDLNETGFADPMNLTMNDLPLIESRLALIEKLSPTATDPANKEGLAEAYKDLLQMRFRVLGHTP